MDFVRRKCLSPNCPAMACPSATGYCSFHDLQRTPFGQTPGKAIIPPTPYEPRWLKDVEPVTEMVQ
jgi:hypothetical protein